MLQPIPTFLQLGEPVFRSPEWNRLADEQGAEAAWRRALVGRDLADLARQVDGPFAVMLRGPDGSVQMAVDRFGMCTLCYRMVDGQIRVAARADELGADDIDSQAIFDYLYFHVLPSPATIFLGVFRLPPAHCANFEGGRLTVRRYWVPTFAPAARASFAALRDEFRSTLEAAVASALRPGVPACFLSGGTDSSTVTGMIAKVAGTAPHTYSIGFDAEGFDEMAYARIAARHFGATHHEHYVTPDDLVDAIPQVAGHYDQPFGNSSAVPAYLCARAARADGTKRLLAGDGGDELFGGNSRYATLRILGWYDVLPRSLRQHVIEPALLDTSLGRWPGLRKGAGYVRQSRAPMPDRMHGYNLLLRLGAEAILTPALLTRVDVQAPKRLQRTVWDDCADTDSELNRTLAYDWRFTLAEADLPKVCGTTAMAGVEVAFPLLDQRLVDFSTRLPASYKLRGLRLRWFFKEALRGFLPDEILSKQKHGFGLPFGVWAVRHAKLKALAVDSLEGLADRGIVNRAFVAELLRERLASQPSYYGEMVWILMMLEQWLRQRAPGYCVVA